MGQDKRSLMMKCKGPVEVKQSKDLFSTSHQQVISGNFLGSTSSVHITVASLDKHHNIPHCPSSFLLCFIAKHNIIWWTW